MAEEKNQQTIVIYDSEEEDDHLNYSTVVTLACLAPSSTSRFVPVIDLKNSKDPSPERAAPGKFRSSRKTSSKKKKLPGSDDEDDDYIKQGAKSRILAYIKLGLFGSEPEFLKKVPQKNQKQQEYSSIPIFRQNPRRGATIKYGGNNSVGAVSPKRQNVLDLEYEGYNKTRTCSYMRYTKTDASDTSDTSESDATEDEYQPPALKTNGQSKIPINKTLAQKKAHAVRNQGQKRAHVVDDDERENEYEHPTTKKQETKDGQFQREKRSYVIKLKSPKAAEYSNTHQPAKNTRRVLNELHAENNADMDMPWWMKRGQELANQEAQMP